MSHQKDRLVTSGLVGSLTVRLSDDLHAAARKAAGSESLNAWIREAVAEKLGRSEMQQQLDDLRARVEQLEKQLVARR